jgi:oxygen-independent coproporphyrinogen-3 oxidase
VSAALGIYLHVPFCAERCAYCSFDTQRGGVRGLDRYLAAMESDLRAAAAEAGGGRPAADTVFFGGGTPSLLPAAAIGRLLAACREAFDVAPGAEVTLEMNPESCEPAAAAALAAAGINRVSLGAQSFHDDVLRRAGRPHDAERTRRAARDLRGAGVGNLNLDLIAGLPGSTVASFRRDLEEALALAPDHLSAYVLETDKPTPLARAAAAGEVRLPDDDEAAGMYETAAAMLPAAGLRHYEISNFARPGRESRHNRKYWVGEPFVGVGPSAWSYLDGRRFARRRGLGRWLEAIEAGRPAAEEVVALPPESAAGEAIYLGLRLLDGVDLGSLSRRFGLDLQARHAEALERLAGLGLVDWDPGRGRARLTRRGLALANEVFAEFVV